MGTVADRRKYAAPLAVLAALALGIFAGRASVLLGDSHIQYGGDAQLVEQPALLLEEYQVTPLDDPEDHLLIDINTAGAVPAARHRAGQGEKHCGIPPALGPLRLGGGDTGCQRHRRSDI